MYIRGSLGFRPVEAEDLELLKELHNEMSTLLQLGNVEMVSSEEQVRWWKNLVGSRTTKRFVIVEVPGGNVVGTIRVQNVDSINRNCEIGLDIVKALRGRGYGQGSYQLVLEYLFMHCNMHMVYLRVGEFNERARRLYQRLGFVESGAFKEYVYRHGRYWDYLLMCMTKEHYLKICENREEGHL